MSNVNLAMGGINIIASICMLSWICYALCFKHKYTNFVWFCLGILAVT